MLKEITKVSKIDGEPRKRWFTSLYFDLIVWYDMSDEIQSFDLCYGKPTSEKVISWSMASGFKHQKVDDGEEEPMKYKMAPIYVPDGEFNEPVVVERFLQESKDIDSHIKQYVGNRITVYCKGK